jgi:hypothetical protein
MAVELTQPLIEHFDLFTTQLSWKVAQLVETLRY